RSLATDATRQLDALERQLADQQLGRLLVPTDLTQRHGARTVAMRLLDAARGWCALARGLGGELLAWSLATRGLACRLLGAGHSLSVAAVDVVVRCGMRIRHRAPRTWRRDSANGEHRTPRQPIGTQNATPTSTQRWRLRWRPFARAKGAHAGR
ncbi:TPA: hypothetical protein N0F65_010926, partial [Lagenidium giganteum]